DSVIGFGRDCWSRFAIAARTSGAGTPLTALIFAGSKESSTSPPDALLRVSLEPSLSQAEPSTRASPSARIRKRGFAHRARTKLLLIDIGSGSGVRSSEMTVGVGVGAH